ncbi:hypothetical protein HPG69_012764 [Diceros bicornis minor]|uniref:Uncharacterized protein n=1 Tax=Diceros bicornis minor TaxID=77932 RepID=A0A7J7EIH9_DICBM|nr:hypothetical protein HPG69_012764 [Diceros bicornis minor]
MDHVVIQNDGLISTEREDLSEQNSSEERDKIDVSRYNSEQSASLLDYEDNREKKRGGSLVTLFAVHASHLGHSVHSSSYLYDSSVMTNKSEEQRTMAYPLSFLKWNPKKMGTSGKDSDIHIQQKVTLPMMTKRDPKEITHCLNQVLCRENRVNKEGREQGARKKYEMRMEENKEEREMRIVSKGEEDSTSAGDTKGVKAPEPLSGTAGPITGAIGPIMQFTAPIRKYQSFLKKPLCKLQDLLYNILDPVLKLQKRPLQDRPLLGQLHMLSPVHLQCLEVTDTNSDSVFKPDRALTMACHHDKFGCGAPVRPPAKDPAPLAMHPVPLSSGNSRPEKSKITPEEPITSIPIAIGPVAAVDSSGKITLSPMVIFPGYMDGELTKISDSKGQILKSKGTTKSQSSQAENKEALKREILFTASDESVTSTYKMESKSKAKGMKVKVKDSDIGIIKRLEAQVKPSDTGIPKRQEAQVKNSEAEIPQGQEAQEKKNEAKIPQGQDAQVKKSETKTAKGQEAQDKKSEVKIPKGQDTQVKKSEARISTGQGSQVKRSEAGIPKGQGSQVKKRQEAEVKKSEARIPRGRGSQVKKENSEDKRKQNKEKGDAEKNKDTEKIEAKNQKGVERKDKVKGKKGSEVKGKKAEGSVKGKGNSLWSIWQLAILLFNEGIYQIVNANVWRKISFPVTNRPKHTRDKGQTRNLQGGLKVRNDDSQGTQKFHWGTSENEPIILHLEKSASVNTEELSPLFTQVAYALSPLSDLFVTVKELSFVERVTFKFPIKSKHKYNTKSQLEKQSGRTGNKNTEEGVKVKLSGLNDFESFPSPNKNRKKLQYAFMNFVTISPGPRRNAKAAPPLNRAVPPTRTVEKISKPASTINLVTSRFKEFAEPIAKASPFPINKRFAISTLPYQKTYKLRVHKNQKAGIALRKEMGEPELALPFTTETEIFFIMINFSTHKKVSLHLNSGLNIYRFLMSANQSTEGRQWSVLNGSPTTHHCYNERT